MYLHKLKRGSVLLFLVFLLSACEQQTKVKTYPFHFSEPVFGTTFNIKLSKLPETIDSKALKVNIRQRLDALNGQMSTYLPDSELSTFNRMQSTDWQVVSPPLFTVLKQAQLIAQSTEGAFDVTVGPLVNLWGFGPDPMSFNAPAEDGIALQMQKIGFQKLELDLAEYKIRKQQESLYVDLSAIAKGYAVDEIGLLLEQYGIKDYMVEIGGELRLRGHNINKQAWRIAVEKPAEGSRVIQKVLPLTDISLATSGDYRNYFEHEGVRFSHTIDPRTGKPISHKLASVTILSDTTMKADAWATALMVLGAEQGLAIAEKEHIAALFLEKTKDGFAEKASSSFLKILGKK